MFPPKAQNEWGNWQIDPPSHVYTPRESSFGALDTILPLLDQKIEKHGKILGLVKFSNLEKIEIIPYLPV